MEAPAATIYRCVQQAGGECAAVRSCFVRSGPSQCDGGGLQTTCDGSVARGCLAGSVPYSIDCAAGGGTCAGATNVFADYFSCTLWDCAKGAGRCTAGQAVYCFGDRFLASVDCSATGATCEESDGGSVCRGAECSKAEARCEGSTAVRCEDGRLTRFDCARQTAQRRCESGRCVATGTRCQVGADLCAGAVLSSCVDGAARSIDCRRAGFTSCASDRCQP